MYTTLFFSNVRASSEDPVPDGKGSFLYTQNAQASDPMLTSRELLRPIAR